MPLMRRAPAAITRALSGEIQVPYGATVILANIEHGTTKDTKDTKKSLGSFVIFVTFVVRICPC
jgi:hypothetical protein